MAVIGFSTNLYFVTSTVVDWIDVFTRPVYKNIVLESLRYCQQQKGLDIYAWVLMTNHLHLIASVRQTDNSGHAVTNISDVLRDFKKFTNKRIITAIQENPQESRKEWILDRCWFRGANDLKIKNFKFWQDGCYIETICKYDFYRQKLDYIHLNPVRQEIVDRPEHYLYSSARDYCGGKGLIDVIVQP